MARGAFMALFYWSGCACVDARLDGIMVDGWVGLGFFCAVAGRLDWLGSQLGRIGCWILTDLKGFGRWFGSWLWVCWKWSKGADLGFMWRFYG